jgi:hypothetical protein
MNGDASCKRRKAEDGTETPVHDVVDFVTLGMLIIGKALPDLISFFMPVA